MVCKGAILPLHCDLYLPSLVLTLTSHLFLFLLKIYNDGTVALLGSNAIDTVLDEEDQSNKTATHHITPTHALAHSEEDGVSDSDAAASSDASYGLRGGRSSARSEGGGRPHRRAAAAVRASRASTAAAAGGGGGSGGGIFKAAAIKILRQELRLMSTGEIARLALKHGLIRCTGKTPEATMASALYTDVKRREELSVFFRPQEGLFGLREWAVKDEEEPSGVPAGCDFHHQEDHAAVAAAAVNQALRAADEAAATTHRVTHDNNNNDNNNPHTGSDAVDRLMELLCAAEEINRASAEEEEEEDMAAHPEKDRMEEEGKVQAQSQYDMAAANEGRSFTTQPFDLPPSAKDVCATTRQGFGPSSTTAESIAAEAVRAAEAAMDRLKKELGAGHPEVSRGYLTLARIYTADMPVATRELAEGTILRAEAVVSECHSALGCHVAASPATLSLLVHRLQQQVEEMAALPSPLADESDGSARSRSRLQQLQTAIRTASVIATTALQAASAAAVHSAGGTCKQETPFMARRQCSSSSNEENIRSQSSLFSINNRNTARLDLRKAKGSFEPDGVSPIAKIPASVSKRSANATAVASADEGSESLANRGK